MRPFSPAWFREERVKQQQRRHVWPLTIVLALVGVAGLIRFVYKGWWLAAAVALVWLAGLAVIGGPSRHAWKNRPR